MNKVRAGWAAPVIAIALCSAFAACVRGAADNVLAAASSDAARPALTDPPAGAATEASEGVPALPRSRWQIWAAWNALRGDAYELDTVERFLEEGQRLECDPSALVRYSGTTLRYRGAVSVNPAFRERLARFEQVVSEVALEVYGRAPQRIDHVGAYNCRSSRKRSYRVSEHALGNAIDVVGFEFAPAGKRQPLVQGLPAPLRHAFQVRVARHWNDDKGKSKTAAVHRRFLRELTARLSEREDVFRVMVGPSRPDHHDHFHFDVSPWRYVYF